MNNNLTLSVTLTGDNRQLSGTLRDAQGDVRAFSTTTERESQRAETALQAPGRQAGTVSEHLRDAGQEARTFGTETDQGGRQASQSLAQTGAQAQTVSTHLNRLRSVALGVVMALVSMAGGLSFGGIISQTAAFEDSILGLQAVSSATVGEIAQLEQQARSLGATSMFSAKQSADAQRFLAQAGFDVNEVMAATPSVLSLATAGQMDLAQAADIASNVLGGMRLEVDQLNRVNDVLAETSARSNTNIMQLGEAFSYAGPFAASAGVSIETTSAAIGVLSDAGLQASRAGTGLIGIIRQLSNVTPQAAGVLASYGLTIEDVNIEAHGLETVLERIRDANISTADSFAIFGSEAGAAAQILAAGAGRVREFTTQLEAAEGATDRMAMIIGSGLTGSMRGFNSMMSESILQLGESGIAGAFELVIDNATGVLAVYNDMLPALAEANNLTDEQVARIEMLAGGVDLLGDALIITTGIMAGRYVGAIAASQAAMTAKAAVVATTTGAINVLTGATTRQAAAATLMAGATRAATSALMLMGGPLGLLVGAGSLLYLFREELGLTTQKAGLTEQQIIDLRNELREMSQEDLSDSLDSLNQSLTEAALKAATAREELAKLRAERDQGQGPRAAFRTLEAGGYAAEIQGMRALQEAEEKLLEIEQRRNATYRESVRRWKERKEATDAVTEATEENGVATEVVTAVTRQATNTVDELTRATNAQATAIENLRNRLVPHRSETVQLAQDQNTLNLAFAMGRITAGEYLYMIGALQTAYIDAQNDTDDLATSTTNALYTMEGAMEELRTNGLRRLDNGFADLWLGAVDGSRNATDTIRRMWDQTLAELLHMTVTRPITVQLAASMGFGGQAGGGASSGGFGINPGGVGNAWRALQGGFNGIQWSGAGGAQAYGGGWANAATSGTGATGYLGGSMRNFSGMQGLAGLGAGFAGNYLGGQLFGQGRHSNTLGTVGGLAGTYLGGPIGALLGSGLGSALGGLFGRSWNETGSGVHLGVSSGNITGNQFSDQHSKGGLFRSSKRRTQTSGLDGEFSGALQQVYDATEASLAATIEVLGFQSSALAGFTTGLTRIDTKGLSAEDAEAKIQEWLGNTLNALAIHSVGDVSQFALGGETTIETVERLAVALGSLNPILEQLHGSTLAASIAGGSAASHLAELAGGIDAFSARADYYYQNVLTETERQERAMRAAAQAMGAFTARTGQVIESTDALRDLVDGIDLTTAAGRELYNEAMNLAPALVEIERGLERVGQRFDQMLQDAESAFANAEAQARRAWQAFDNQAFSQQITLLGLLGDSESALALERERELATIDESLRPTQERIWAIQDEIAAQQNATQAARNYQRELTRVRDQLNQSLANVGTWLDQQLATSGTPESNLATAQEQLARQLVLAESGDRNALQNITQYAQQVLDANRDYNASSAAGQRIQQDVYDAIAGLPAAINAEQYLADEIRTALFDALEGKATDSEIQALMASVANGDMTIEAALKQVYGASQGTEANTDSLEKQARDQLKELNGLVGEMTRTTDQFVGLNATMVSLRDAIIALGVAQDDITRIEEERAAAEQAERDRISNERTVASYSAQADNYNNRALGSIGRAQAGVTADSLGRSDLQEITQLISGYAGDDQLLQGNEYAALRETVESMAPGHSRGVARTLALAAREASLAAFSERDAANVGVSGDDQVGATAVDFWELFSTNLRFAKGGVFTNSIVSSPTQFNMAEMGEAGPEAIMPLKRHSDGSLGVRAELPAFPQFPALNSNDIVETLRDLKRENQQLRADLGRLLERISDNTKGTANAVASSAQVAERQRQAQLEEQRAATRASRIKGRVL